MSPARATPPPPVRRRSPLRFPTLACLLFATLLPLTPAVSSAGGVAASGGERERLEEVRRRIEEVSGRLSGTRDQHSKLREELKQNEVAIGETTRALRAVEARRRDKSAELARLRARRQEAGAAIEAQRTALERQVVAAYMMGREGQIKLILNQQDPALLGRMLAYYDYVARARAERIAEITAGLAEIDALERGIADEQAALDELHAERTRQMQALDGQRQSRRQVLARLETDIRTQEQQLATLRQDERTLSELVDRLREALRDVPIDLPPDGVPFASLKGKLPWPVKGKLAARFGSSRQVERLTWRGTLIDAEEGAEVRAIYNGRVAFADWMRGFGLLIIVDHGGGYMSLYGHNQSLYKAVGEPVRKGETIATVGNSGGRSQPGLYFEIRHNGVPDNPVSWCRGTPG